MSATGDVAETPFAETFDVELVDGDDPREALEVGVPDEEDEEGGTKSP